LAPESEYDYVIVGSGAGGGMLAARLAEEGMRVVLLEAGGAPHSGGGLPEEYEAPGFHPFASENPAMSWDFFVRHYADKKRQKADWKMRPDPDTGEPSIFYPRAGTLGGCTAHNAMIFLAPHDSDWEEIARVTGDGSWSARNMRRYFRLLENCRHRPLM
jgi:choline dehydrogenase-like flavoprotein